MPDDSPKKPAIRPDPGKHRFRVPAGLKVFLVLALLMAAAALLSKSFLHPENLWNILQQQAPVGVVAVGMTFVILTGGIDLSVGGTVALVSVVMAGAAVRSPAMALLVGLSVGCSVGIANGLLITVGAISPFIATLAMMAVTQGAALWYSNGEQKVMAGNLFQHIGLGDVLSIPIPAFTVLAVLFLAWLVLEYTVYGRHVYAVGSNSRAARAAGIDVERTTLSVYVLCGLLAGVSSILITARLNTGSPKLGDMYELDAIAAVIIGGASLFGGRGSVLGTFGGVLIMGVINNILVMRGVSPYSQRVAKGAVIALAVLLQSGGYRGALQRFRRLWK